jgi:hypothetical protein
MRNQTTIKGPSHEHGSGETALSPWAFTGWNCVHFDGSRGSLDNDNN